MKDQEIIYCAGGLVWRDAAEGRQILLIMSRNDGAWKLPKGHIDAADPTWEAAAKREVLEETGYETIITDFAGFTKYPVGGVPKVVLYWHMQAGVENRFVPNDEISAIAWLPVAEAIDRLTFLNDKKFLLQFVSTKISPSVHPAQHE